MNGFINLNKSAGASSAKAVSVIKRLSHTPCGHMGTLDPMASGVLPVAIGNACRLFDYFLSKRKAYVATFKFGEDYDTLDTTGEVRSSGGRVPSAEEICSVIPELVGEIMQIPPRYSAKSVGGKRGYELARSGVEFSLPPKKVSVYGIELLEKINCDSFSFKIECGGGTYIRSIARDMAKLLGTYGAMSALVRTQSGPFTIENSVRAEDLSEDNLQSYLIPTESLLPFESFYAEGVTAKKLFNGLTVKCNLADGIYKIYNENDFYGLAAVEAGNIKIRIKLC